MNRVLVIAYYFPPMGMGGVQRAVKFVKYLPEFGWEPTVLTVKDVLYYARDDSFEEDMKDASVVRTESLDPLRLGAKWSDQKSAVVSGRCGHLGKLHGMIARWMAIPDPKVLWIPHAVQAALKLIHQNKIDLILTTSPPHSAHLIGWYLKRMTGVPWVADFRDDWLGMYFDDLPTRAHAGLNRWIIRQIIEKANGIVTVSEPIRDVLLAISRNTKSRCEVIRNGYDRSEFEGVSEGSRDLFTITYSGTVSPLLNPSVFLQGVAQALDQRTDLRTRIRVRFIGGIIDLDLSHMIESYGLNDIVSVEGYLPHDESVGRMIDSDLLLLLLPESGSAGLVTGKVYEYLASGKPILALAPCGEDEQLIIKHARGVVVPPEDVEGVAGRIVRSFELWERGDLKITKPRWEGIEVYDRRYLTRLLAFFFDKVVAPY